MKKLIFKLLGWEDGDEWRWTDLKRRTMFVVGLLFLTGVIIVFLQSCNTIIFAPNLLD
jgi:hypothetical protein